MEASVLKFLKITHNQLTWRSKLRSSKEPWLPYYWDSATCYKGNTEQRRMKHRHELVFLYKGVAWKRVGIMVKDGECLNTTDTYNLTETLNQGLSKCAFDLVHPERFSISL